MPCFVDSLFKQRPKNTTNLLSCFLGSAHRRHEIYRCAGVVIKNLDTVYTIIHRSTLFDYIVPISYNCTTIDLASDQLKQKPINICMRNYLMKSIGLINSSLFVGSIISLKNSLWNLFVHTLSFV